MSSHTLSSGADGGGSTTLPSTLILADGTTVTVPDGLIERHTTSGTAGVGFGLTDAIELQSAAGNVRRAMTDVTKWTTATDGAEVASRTISLMDAGALQTCLTLARGTLTLAGAANNQTELVFAPTSCKVSLDAVFLNLNLLGGGRDVVVGAAGALATSATLGHFQIPTCAGTPTGSLAALQTGKAALILDTTGSKLWCSSVAGTWKGVVIA